MKNILRLDNSYDLWLSYSWSTNNHGICGHIFEVFDYYFILKDHFKVGILFSEDIDWNTVKQSIENKYDFTEEEINDLKYNIVFANKPSLVQGKNILFTDGGVINLSKITLLFDNILLFACGNKEIKDNQKENVYILQDDRVYEPVKVNGINYKKRILFDRLKKNNFSEDKILIYATKNCRNIDNFSQFLEYGKKVLVIVNDAKEDADTITFLNPPVKNLFDKFDTFVYTPVPRKWDCSPRFIAECKYYNKNVIYHNIDYWHIDHGLFWRKWDIDNDFDSLFLKPNDEIVDIVKKIIQ
jgi:hypothetical protein